MDSLSLKMPPHLSYRVSRYCIVTLTISSLPVQGSFLQGQVSGPHSEERRRPPLPPVFSECFPGPCGPRWFRTTAFQLDHSPISHFTNKVAEFLRGRVAGPGWHGLYSFPGVLLRRLCDLRLGWFLPIYHLFLLRKGVTDCSRNSHHLDL